MQADLTFGHPGAGPNVGGYVYPPSIIVENRNTSEPQIIESTIVRGPDENELKLLIDDRMKPVLNELKGLRQKVKELEEAAAYEPEEYEEPYVEEEPASPVEEDVAPDPDDLLEAENDLGVRDNLRLVDLSARAVDIMNDVLLTTSWNTCSRNTYGFFIRNVLLMGSKYENQLVEDTSSLFVLSAVGVFISISMQFILAYFLFARMPDYWKQGGESGQRTIAHDGAAPLPSYPFPSSLYQHGNDVCRTVQIVQIVCIGLFLFLIFNNVPGILRHIRIIWFSERFMTKAEDDVTKIFYWRESSFNRVKSEDDQVRNDYVRSLMNGGTPLCPNCLSYCRKIAPDQIENKVCGECSGQACYNCRNCSNNICQNCWKPSSKPSMRQSYALALSKSEYTADIKSLSTWFSTIGSTFFTINNKQDTKLPRTFFEINDARNFIAEILVDLDPSNGKVVRKTGKPDAHASTFADKAKVNLVRAAYLTPNKYKYPSFGVFIPTFYWFTSFFQWWPIQQALADAKLQKKQAKAKKGPLIKKLGTEIDAKPQTKNLMEYVDLHHFKDLPFYSTLYTYNFHFFWLRLFAFVFGVLTEMIALFMIAIAGIQYILWSGYKIGSDSQGMEEIILATVAITFIYDIDDAIYEHVLPEFYKEAHERDKFDVQGWTPRGQSKQTELVMSMGYNIKIFMYSIQSFLHSFGCIKAPNRLEYTTWAERVKSAKKKAEDPHNNKEKTHMNEEKHFLKLKWQKQYGNDNIPKWNDQAIPVTEALVCHMTSDIVQYSDLYLALQYPFLYAKKFKYFFSSHLQEMFLDFYGKKGVHYIVLLVITLAIVGAYRTAANCGRFAPHGWNKDSPTAVWATQEWPDTCLMTMRTPIAQGSDFSELYKDQKTFTVPVSCGANGYLPDNDEELTPLIKNNYAMKTFELPA